MHVEAVSPIPVFGRARDNGLDVVADVWLGSKFCFIKILILNLLLGGGLGGSWDAGLGLEILPKTIAFTSLKLSPIGLT